jgi:hypothetical protein
VDNSPPELFFRDVVVESIGIGFVFPERFNLFPLQCLSTDKRSPNLISLLEPHPVIAKTVLKKTKPI